MHIWKEITFVWKYFPNSRRDFRIKDAVFGLALLWVVLCIYLLSSHPLSSLHSLTLEVMNKSTSAESNKLLYCLHTGDYLEKTSIRPWSLEEYTLLNSSGLRSGVGDDIVFSAEEDLIWLMNWFSALTTYWISQFCAASSEYLMS